MMRCQNPSCGVEFDSRPGPKGGRPRKYCTDACRLIMLRTVYQPAYHKRQAVKRSRSIW